MTHAKKSSALMAVLQPNIQNGFDGLGEMMAVAVNFAMELEREKYLGTSSHERPPARTSPFHPQSIGKLERFHLRLKSESIRLHSLST